MNTHFSLRADSRYGISGRSMVKRSRQSSTHVGWLEYISEEHWNWAEWVSFARTTDQSILLGFSAAIRRHKVEAWSDQQIILSALETLRTIFGEDIPLPGSQPGEANPGAHKEFFWGEGRANPGGTVHL
jgi:hypothetical protein